MKEVLGMALGEFVIALVTGSAAIIALIIGLLTLFQSASLRRREYKARLLDEVKKWALDFLNTEIPSIRPIETLFFIAKDENLLKADNALQKAERELKHASIAHEAIYIAALVEKMFEKELGEIFNKINDLVVAEGYLTSLDAKTAATYEFRSSNRKMIEELQEILKSRNKTLEQLLNEYRTLLRKQLATLLEKTADVKAKLL